MQLGFGSGLMWGLRNDISPATPYRLGALQDVQIDFKGEIKELYGQFQFPIDVARGKVKVTGKAKLAEISALAYNNLYFGQTVATGQILTAYNEDHVIPTTPFTVTITPPSGGVFLNDLGVRFTVGNVPLARVTTPTVTGQYSVNEATGIYTFSSADGTGTKHVLIDYSYTVTAGFQIALSATTLMGNTPRFKVVFSDTFEGNTVSLVLNACVSDSFSLPTKIDDYMISDFNFSAFADSSGNLGNLSTTLGSL
jgi:hypothetical protein